MSGLPQLTPMCLSTMGVSEMAADAGTEAWGWERHKIDPQLKPLQHL